jgi:glutamate 5-kinase
MPAAAGARRDHRHAAAGATQKSQARKRWMADHLQLRGAVTVDEGAVPSCAARARACCHRHDAVKGDFQRRARCATRAAVESRAAWPTMPVPRRAAVPQAFGRDRALLGYMAEPEMIHRTVVT